MLGPAIGAVADAQLDVDGALVGEAPPCAFGELLENFHRIDALDQLCEYCRLITEAGTYVENAIGRL